MSDDDVVDFLVTEAIMLRVDDERQKQQKDQEREAWRKGHRQMQQPVT